MKEDDYFAGVDWLQRIDPENVMLKRLSKSYTTINTIYLGRILKELGERPLVATVKAPEVDRLDPDFVDVQNSIGRLFGRRRQLSNQFHNAKSVTDCARISDDIRNIQQQIKTLLRQRRHYEQYGTLPEDVDEEEENFEELAGIQLQRRYNANSKRRNYAKRQMAEWAKSNAPDADRELTKWQLKYKTEQDEFYRLSKALREAAL